MTDKDKLDKLIKLRQQVIDGGEIFKRAIGIIK